MTFVVTLIALLIERFFDCTYLRRWQWFATLERRLAQKAGKSPYLSLILTIVPVLIIAALIEFLLKGWLFGLLRLIFQLIILIYCFGPKNLWVDVFATIQLFHQDEELVHDKLKTHFRVANELETPALRLQFVSHIFVEANRRVFAVLFWFTLLGPLGALLYRMISLSVTDLDNEVIRTKAQFLENILDWLPVRFFTFFLALGGHFTRVFNCWRKKLLAGLSSNKAILTECGMAALGNGAENQEEETIEKHVISLIDRVLVITLVVIAVGVLIF